MNKVKFSLLVWGDRYGLCLDDCAGWKQPVAYNAYDKFYNGAALRMIDKVFLRVDEQGNTRTWFLE